MLGDQNLKEGDSPQRRRGRRDSQRNIVKTYAEMQVLILPPMGKESNTVLLD